MRILRVIPGLTLERGGPSSGIQACVPHLVDLGHEVRVLTTNQGERYGETPLSISSKADLKKLCLFGPDRWAYSPRFRKFLRPSIEWADVVHIHSLFTFPVHVTLDECRRFLKPVVLQPHGCLHNYSLNLKTFKKRLYLSLFGRSIRKSVTCWCYTSSREARESWPGTAAAHFILPNGIEPGRYDICLDEARAMVNANWPNLNDQPIILFLGRLHPKKRLDFLVQVFREVDDGRHHLVIAGPDECGMQPRLESLAGPSLPRIHFLGPVSGENQIALYTTAKLFVLPSEHENFGITVIESLAAGTRVLATPYVDSVHLAADAGHAEVISLDSQVWAARLRDIMAYDKPENDDRQVIKRWAERNYRWSVIVDELVGHYQQVIDSRSDSMTGSREPTSVS